MQPHTRRAGRLAQRKDQMDLGFLAALVLYVLFGTSVSQAAAVSVSLPQPVPPPVRVMPKAYAAVVPDRRRWTLAKPRAVWPRRRR